MTGSLDGTETNKLVLEGLFGQAKQIVTTAELIDRKVLANLNVKMLILKHPESVCKDVTSVKDYHYEIAKIVSSNERNNYICKLALGLAEENKNVMILYQYVDDHGILLYDKIIQSTDDTPKYIIHGKIKAEIREQTRQAIIASDRSITVASMGCFAEGINIPNLDYLILASPTKSRVKVMQMIGRVLRRTETKHECIVFDIVDDLMYKNRINYTMKHYRERLKYYTEENFKYTQYKINLTDLSTK
jgi:superfamily II DNA or RNA helicase